MNSNERSVRYCPELSYDDEAKLLRIARRSRDRWFVFSAYFPNGDHEEFASEVLGDWPDDSLRPAAECLIRQFVHLDHEISETDEGRLRQIAERLRRARKTWPASSNYFEHLERAVAEEFQNDYVTTFRIRALAGRLSDLFIFGH